jgi:LacI family transcriptional regulator
LADEGAPAAGGAAAYGGSAATGHYVPRSRKTVTPLTIYDVARSAGLSIASVSRVLNNHGTPRPETRERVLRAVSELGYVPDGAARALSNRLKEIVGVVYRRIPLERSTDPGFEDESHSLVFMDVVNRGVEAAAQSRGYDLLMTSIGLDSHAPGPKIAKLAAKSDGVILHDRLLTSAGIARLAARVPVVTLAGTPTRVSVNIGVDNTAGMRELAHHLLADHEYREIAYLAGLTDSPDNVARARVLREEAAQFGVAIAEGPRWSGDYSAAGGARVMRDLLEQGERPPRVICCANDQTALGVFYVLRQHGYRIPQDVAVTGFDDVSVARHVNPALTTVRQPIHELGAAAFDLLHAMIGGERPARRNVLLPVRVVYRASCGCAHTPVLTRAGESRS